MKIRLLAIGSRPDDWVRSGVDTYLERLPAHLKPELVEIPLSLRSSGGDPAVAKAKEGQRILQRLKPHEFVIVLDERGKPWSSVELSRQLVRWQVEESAIALVIGGPEGLADEVRKRANQSWSLSALTFPHGMVRVIVVEQLYRAWTILQGHPYHKI
jgi:23S rRNA (pseudouridine1915-N3)-methyltransferase